MSRATVANANIRRRAAAIRETSLRRAKQLAKDCLGRAGLQVSLAGNGPRRSLREVLAHVKKLGVARATVIDVGVEAGTPELYTAFIDADLLLVEPMKEWRGHLEQLVRDDAGRTWRSRRRDEVPGKPLCTSTGYPRFHHC